MVCVYRSAHMVIEALVWVDDNKEDHIGESHEQARDATHEDPIGWYEEHVSHEQQAAAQLSE